jgi:hypothetical protein
VALGEAGDVYVVDKGNNRVEWFSPEGKEFKGQFDGHETPAGGFSSPTAISIDDSADPLDPSAGDVYVLDSGHDVIDKFEADGKYLGQITEGAAGEPLGELDGVAVDPQGTVWVYQANREIDSYSSGLSNIFLSSRTSPFGGTSPGFAVDAEDNLYVNRGAEVFAKLNSSGEILVEEFVQGEGEHFTAAAVDQTTGELFVDHITSIVTYASEPQCTATSPCGESVKLQPLDSFSSANLVEGAGIAVDAATALVYVAAAGSNEVEVYEKVGARVEDETVTSLNEGEASVQAQIGVDGPATRYYVEYGPTTEYGSRTQTASIGAPIGNVSATARLENLEASTAYHYRFVAINEYGTSYGGDATFTTAASAATTTALPDNRAYELVSFRDDTEVYPPPFHQSTPDETLGHVATTPTQVGHAYESSANGNEVAFDAEPPASGVGGAGNGNSGGGNQYLARRGSSGWEVSDLELPAGGVESPSNFPAFSSDLSTYIIETGFHVNANPPLAADCEHLEMTYSHDESGYHPLIPSPSAAVQSQCQATGAVISGNDEHSLLYSQSALTPQAMEGKRGAHPDLGTVEGTNLYDATAGRLYQVNVLPNGEAEPDPNALFGGRAYYQEGYYELTYEHAISFNGSRVFWTAQEGEGENIQPRALYVRENDTQPQSPIAEGRCTVPADACTVQLDRAEAGAPESGGGRFWAASADGSRVYFTDCRRLTPDATAHPEDGCEAPSGDATIFSGNDLYEYDFAKPEGSRLTDLTVDHNHDALGADVQGVIGASEDGSRVYFVADGVLTSGPNVEGKAPQPGQPNLYVSTNGTATFVATLSVEDDAWSEIRVGGANGEHAGDWRIEPGARTAEVTTGGNAVGFMSTRALTGYDNYGLSTVVTRGTETELRHAGLPEVFVYNANTERISCASCNPSNLPPVQSGSDWEDERNSYTALGGTPTFMPRWINETEGVQLYFMTNQPLVSQDTNERQDVYEWESDGSGLCRRGSGCIAPLSSVTTPNPAFLIDASADGSDVFFTQRASLVPHAGDEDVKLYDARVDGGFPEPSLACTGTGCQGAPPAPPQFATPASDTFAGAENYAPVSTANGKPLTRAQKLAKALKTCRKKPTSKRRSCERRARKLYGPAKKKGKR